MRVGDQPLVHARTVAVAARPDLLDVGVDLRLLGGQVVDDDGGVPGLVAEVAPRHRQRGQLGVLGQRAALVPELVGAGVELLDVQQRELDRGVGFQVGLLR